MKADFNIEGEQIVIQCLEDETIENLYVKCLNKLNKGIDLNDTAFMYNGKMAEPFAKIKDIINRHDKERNRLSIIVNKNDFRILKHRNIICPDCFSDADLFFKDFKINLRCQNGHINNNLDVSEFRKKQEIETSKIICQICKNVNLSKAKEENFFRCVKCSISMCCDCKQIHLNENDKKHKNYVVQYRIENYECTLHNKPFNSYCKKCKKDLCESCMKNHESWEIKEYHELLPDENRKKEIKEKISEAEKSLIEQINSIIENLNEIKSYMTSFNRLNMELLDNYNPNEINYKMVKNINSINFDAIINDLNKININDDLINKFQNIMNLYYRKKYSNELTLIYKIKKNAKCVKIFGDEFVRNNEAKCKMIIDNEESELKSDIYINSDFQRKKSKIMVVLKDVNKITNLKEAFKDTSLHSIPDISKLDMSKMTSMEGTFENCTELKTFELKSDLKNVKNVSHLFSGCTSIEYINLDLKNCQKIEDMSYMFHNNTSLRYVEGIRKCKTINVKNMECMFLGCDKLERIEDISDWDNRNVEDMNEMFKNCKSLKVIPNIGKWNIKNVKDLHELFSGCNSLQSLPDISKWNLSNVNDIHGLFSGCSSLISLPDISKWQINNVNNLSSLFADCIGLLQIPDISKWDLSNVKDISRLFYNCFTLKQLPDLKYWNTSKAVNMDEIFSRCQNLLYLPDISYWNTSKVKSMRGLFNKCSKLEFIPKNIAKWNTKNVTKMDFMFNECSSLKILPDINKWNMVNVTNINSMFSQCYCLTRIPDISEWDVSNINSMSCLFAFCPNIEDVPNLSSWNINNVYDMSWMFYQCNSLINIPNIFKGVLINENVNTFEMFKRNSLLNEMPQMGFNSISMENMIMRQNQPCQQMGFNFPFMPY